MQHRSFHRGWGGGGGGGRGEGASEGGIAWSEIYVDLLVLRIGSLSSVVRALVL